MTALVKTLAHQLVAVLLAALLALPAQAGDPDYGAFSDRDGNIATEQHHAAAMALVRNPEQLEAVYSDAAQGNARAKRVWQELEANLSGSGVEVAERATRSECLVPIYRELSGSCRPDWSFLDFLAKDKSGAAQLRKVVFDAFAARARQRGLENEAILSAAGSLLAVGGAAATLRAGCTTTGTLKVPEAPTLKPSGAPRGQPSRLPPASPVAAKGPIWTATKNKTPVENAYRHFKDHGTKVGAQDALDYARKAQDSSTTLRRAP